MSRSGYSDDCENLELWRANVDRTIAGKTGQKFLRELAHRMDEMPDKRLIKGELITPSGECCAIGVVCKSRSLKVDEIEVGDFEAVSDLVGITSMLAQEIEYINDECGHYGETPEETWYRMRRWVSNNILGEK